MRISEKQGFAIFISFLVISYLIAAQNDKKIHQRLIEKGIYTIAIIDSYKPLDSRPSKVVYSFKIGEQFYQDSHSYVPSGVKIGDKYFLLVNKDKYKETEIFFDRPIIDSIDFKRYIKEFDEIRKQKN